MAISLGELLNYVKDPGAQRAIHKVFTDLDAEVDAIRALISEFRTDHLGSGASYQSWLTEVDADLDEINDYLHYLNERDGVIGGTDAWAMASETATTFAGAGRIRYRIDGIEYECAVSAHITPENVGDITQNKYGAWRVLIDAAGTITTQAAVTAGDMAFDDRPEALLSLSHRAITAGTCEIGYITMIDTNEAFDVGTHNTDRANCTDTFIELREPRLASGLDTALGASLACNAGESGFDLGTVNAHRLGVSASQIGAANNQALNDADTVGVADFGGWLVVTDPDAGTALHCLATDGVAGSVTAMTHADAATRNTALDTIEAQLPAVCTVCGRILLENVGGGNVWEATTDDWDHDTAVVSVEDAVFGTHDRTDTIGAQHGINAPAIPDTVTAAVPASVESAAVTESLTT